MLGLITNSIAEGINESNRFDFVIIKSQDPQAPPGFDLIVGDAGIVEKLKVAFVQTPNAVERRGLVTVLSYHLVELFWALRDLRRNLPEVKTVYAKGAKPCCS